MVGWVEKELAPDVADTLRRFKVIFSLCGLPYVSPLVFSPFLVDEVSWGWSGMVRSGVEANSRSSWHFLGWCLALCGGSVTDT